MAKHILGSLIIILWTILLSACGQQNGLEDIQVSFEGEKEVIPTGEMTTYIVKLGDASGKPIDVEKVYLYMNMKMMNHPTEGTMKRVDTGTYQLDLPLAMAGEWYANVTISEGGQQREIEGFKQQAEGEKKIELMKGYHADQQKGAQ